MKEGTCVLGARGAARLRSGHPWIFRTDVQASMPGGRDDLQILDERGRHLGSGLWANAPAPIALRVYERAPEHVLFDAILPDRLARAIASRARAYGSTPEVCRLVHAEADFIPGLFVDRYGDAAVVQSATGAIDRREREIAARLAEVLGLRLVVARDDGSMRDHEALPRKKEVLAGGGPTLVSFAEGAATFTLDLLEDAKTGSFLDQRENHVRVGALAEGDCLDAFTYHGGFALAMARKATSVLAIDEDPAAAARATENARVSGFTNVEVRAADAFAVLRELERTGRKFQTVVIDPPALAKRRGPIDAAVRAYQELNLRALRLTEKDGWLVSCSCSGKMTPQLFDEMLVEAARLAGRDVSIVERRGAGQDHPVRLGVPETEYLKCWIMSVR
jgi:23S rRNA (cytosine1962-C5)-methyltransferase